MDEYFYSNIRSIRFTPSEYPHESSCGRPSSRTFFSFPDRTFVRWIQWFGWFRTVVRLVLSVQMDLQAVFFFASRCGLRWCSVDRRLLDFGERHAGWFFEPVAAVHCSGFLSIWQWTSVCVLRTGRAAHQLSFVDVTVFMRRQKEKREERKFSTTTQQETIQNIWAQTVQTTRLGWQTGQDFTHHLQPEPMTSTVREQKLQFSICKTTRRFAGPSLLSCGLKPSFTKICIRISFCKTSLIMFESLVWFRGRPKHQK